MILGMEKLGRMKGTVNCGRERSERGEETRGEGGRSGKREGSVAGEAVSSGGWVLVGTHQ